MKCFQIEDLWIMRDKKCLNDSMTSSIPAQNVKHIQRNKMCVCDCENLNSSCDWWNHIMQTSLLHATSIHLMLLDCLPRKTEEKGMPFWTCTFDQWDNKMRTIRCTQFIWNKLFYQMVCKVVNWHERIERNILTGRLIDSGHWFGK